MNLEDLVGRHPGGDTVRRALGRAARRAFGATATAEARAAADDVRRVGQPVTTCRRILVAGVRGGAGATTLAALLCLAYTGHRRDRTLAMDTTHGHGSLPFRISDVPVWSYQDVAYLARQPNVDHAARLVRTRGRLSVLPRPPGMDIDGYWTTSAMLTRFAGIAVVDGGGEALAVPGYLRHTHALVLAIPATVDGVRTALVRLSATDPQVWRRTVPVLVDHAPVRGLRPGPTLRALSTGGAPPTWLGYDRSLATGAPLRPKRLSQETVDAVLRVAGSALSLACAGPR